MFNKIIDCKKIDRFSSQGLLHSICCIKLHEKLNCFHLRLACSLQRVLFFHELDGKEYFELNARDERTVTEDLDVFNIPGVSGMAKTCCRGELTPLLPSAEELEEVLLRVTLGLGECFAALLPPR